jgi:hypothetical protein
MNESTRDAFKRFITPPRFTWLSHPIDECKYHSVFCPGYRYGIRMWRGGSILETGALQLCKQKDGE